MMDKSQDIRLEIRSDPDLLPAVRGMIANLCERYGFSDMEIGHISLAVDEALANVIRHGYDSRLDGPIWISCSMLPGPPISLRIVIEDEGKQIDPGEIKGRDLDEIRPGGLGVHIMREVMDTCEFQIRDGAGMRLVLEKKATELPRDMTETQTKQGYE